MLLQPLRIVSAALPSPFILAKKIMLEEQYLFVRGGLQGLLEILGGLHGLLDVGDGLTAFQTSCGGLHGLLDVCSGVHCLLDVPSTLHGLLNICGGLLNLHGLLEVLSGLHGLLDIQGDLYRVKQPQNILHFNQALINHLVECLNSDLTNPIQIQVGATFFYQSKDN